MNYQINTNSLKSKLDLRDLADQVTTLRGNNEKYGQCPKCEGKDRFHVTQGWFFCRKCHPDRGDAIEFVQWMHGLDFLAACRLLGNGDLPELEMAIFNQKRRRLTLLKPPSSTWQEQAGIFVARAQANLWKPEGKAGLDYLFSRGLNESTIRKAELGFNSKDFCDKPERWGVSGSKSIWLAGPGIVIPWQIGEKYHRVNIRRLNPGDGPKYIGPSGWAGANPLYNADALHPAKPAIVVEGEFCAMTINQETGDLITAVATGSTGAGRADKWVARLAASRLVLISFDAEPDKGDVASKKWLALLPNARQWRPVVKDVNDMHRAGIDVRSWIETGLKTFGYESERS